MTSASAPGHCSWAAARCCLQGGSGCAGVSGIKKLEGPWGPHVVKELKVSPPSSPFGCGSNLPGGRQDQGESQGYWRHSDWSLWLEWMVQDGVRLPKLLDVVDSLQSGWHGESTPLWVQKTQEINIQRSSCSGSTTCELSLPTQATCCSQVLVDSHLVALAADACVVLGDARIQFWWIPATVSWLSFGLRHLQKFDFLLGLENIQRSVSWFGPSNKCATGDACSLLLGFLDLNPSNL